MAGVMRSSTVTSHISPARVRSQRRNRPAKTENRAAPEKQRMRQDTLPSAQKRDVAALAEAVRAVLDDPDAAQRRAVAARERLTNMK